MEQPVTGQVAIVTGAGQGIGRAIAHRLSQDGMKLVLVDLQGDAVARVADEIQTSNGTAIALPLNMLRADDRQHMIDTALSTFHRLDALVNNAGVQRIAQPLEVDEEHWDMVMNVNAKAVCLFFLPTCSPTHDQSAQRAHRQPGFHRREDGQHHLSPNL